MRRWINVSMWTGGCAALLVTVRSILGTPPAPDPALAANDLSPPVVVVGNSLSLTPAAPSAVELRDAVESSPAPEVPAVSVPRDAGASFWRLPPPIPPNPLAASANFPGVAEVAPSLGTNPTAEPAPRFEIVARVPEAANREAAAEAVHSDGAPELALAANAPSQGDVPLPETVPTPASSPAPTDPSSPPNIPVSELNPSTIPDSAAMSQPTLVTDEPDPRRIEAFAERGQLEAEPIGPPPQLPTMVAQRIQALVDRGFGLGERGAYYSSREDFLEAVRLVAQSLDAESGGQAYTQALSRGMRALSEADDFQVAGERLDSEYNVLDLARGHKTPVLQSTDNQVTPLEAMQRYFSYAEEQLSLAGGKEAVASRAWYALGKLQPLLASEEAASLAAAPRGLVLFRVALRVDERNHLAQHELGVLLARYGRYDAARQMLEQAAQARPAQETYRNLAVVYTQLGETQRAATAHQQAQQLAAQAPASAQRPAVKVIDAELFRQMSPPSTADMARTPYTQQPGPASAQR